MKRAFSLMVLAFCMLPAAAGAQSAGLGEGDRQAIRAVIEDQLAAFQRDDATAAFANASPTIRAKFQSPEIFMRMVREGYGPVYRPRHVEFRDIVDLRGTPTQRVYVVGPDGVPVVALYPMERQADGTWKIGGCYLVRAGDDMV